MKKATLRAGAPIVAIVALGIAVAGGSAAASTDKAEDAAVVKMELEGKELFFTYPETVEAGRNLKIKNNTNARKVGPHTFSLVQRSTLPRTDEQIKKCARKFVKICGAVIKWHQVDLQTGEIGRNPVEAGKNGWDEQGNLKHRGDSWATEAKGQAFKQKVKADVGKTLHFFCAVHPEMQGKIRVVEG